VQRFEAGDAPSAVSISLLDIKGPAVWHGEIDPTEHWVFSHFLIDGTTRSAPPVKLDDRFVY
jgi:hypothetical protein